MRGAYGTGFGVALVAAVLLVPPSTPTPTPPPAPITAASGPRECQYYVIGSAHRTIDVVLPFDHFRKSWPVTVEVVKGGAAWAQVAHADATTEFVRFTAPYAGVRTVTVGTTKCAVV